MDRDRQEDARVFALYPSLAVDRSSEAYQQNVKDWTEVLKKYQEGLAWCASQGAAHYEDRHKQRGLLLARDRVHLLIDPDTPFLELGPFAGYKLETSSPAASLITGIGVVCGVKCMIIAHIPTLSGAAWNEFTLIKQNRMTEIATQNHLPLIALVQSAGVFLPQQFKVFHKAGKIFKDLAQRSALGTPSCAVVFGSSTAGGAYQPGMSDYTIFIKDQAQVFLGGPPLVKMATGEIVDSETLGGAEMHSSKSGLSDMLASDEFSGILAARRWIKSLNSTVGGALSWGVRGRVLEPKYDVEDLLGIIGTDIKKSVLPMGEIVARIVDASRFEIFKPLYGKNMLCCWAYIHGYLTGIIANAQPVIFVPEANKTTQFIRLCNASNIPIIYLHNVTGFMVGAKTEAQGIIKAGAQLVNTVSNSKVPQISIICGASYGAGNYAMCGRSYDPRFLFSWPIGRCSVMGPDQLSGVMSTIAREAAASNGKEVDEAALAQRTETFRKSVEHDSTAYYTSAHVLDDGIIDPRDTRDVLGMCLEIVSTERIKGNEGFRGVSRM